MSTAATKEPPAPQPTRIDPDATYTAAALATALGVTDRTLRTWRGEKTMRFPQPFFIGRTPHWQGRVVANWMDREQDKVEKARRK